MGRKNPARSPGSDTPEDLVPQRRGHDLSSHLKSPGHLRASESCTLPLELSLSITHRKAHNERKTLSMWMTSKHPSPTLFLPVNMTLCCVTL